LRNATKHVQLQAADRNKINPGNGDKAGYTGPKGIPIDEFRS